MAVIGNDDAAFLPKNTHILPPADTEAEEPGRNKAEYRRENKERKCQDIKPYIVVDKPVGFAEIYLLCIVFYFDYFFFRYLGSFFHSIFLAPQVSARACRLS